MNKKYVLDSSAIYSLIEKLGGKVIDIFIEEDDGIRSFSLYSLAV